jgi:predicted MPP superfamily phosphohydrolase
MNETLLPKHAPDWSSRSAVKKLLWSAAGSCALTGLYAWRLEDHHLRVERHEMALRNLGPAWRGARIAHISDLHCSPIVLQSYLRECIRVVNELEPDFVVITGDFITGLKFYARRVGKVCSHLRPRVATLACLGNHDYGMFLPTRLGHVENLADVVTASLADAGVRVLRNEAVRYRRAGQPLQLVGVEDMWAPTYDPDRAFGPACRTCPTVALVHNPDAAEHLVEYKPDWILAGHTHGTEPKKPRNDASPLSAFRSREFFAGRYAVSQQTKLYVNRGLSYGRRLNLNARPEVTLFTLTRAHETGL